MGSADALLEKLYADERASSRARAERAEARCRARDDDGDGTEAAAAAAAALPAAPRAGRAPRDRRSATPRPRGRLENALRRMGSTCAAGGLRDGKQRIIAVEAPDAILAYALAGFKSYHKPGGKYVNTPIDARVRRAWRRHGVAFGEFTLRDGDAYIIPAGVPHEFRNDKPSLSIAWNFLQPGAHANALCAAITQYALDEVDRSFHALQDMAKQGVTEHAPIHLVRERFEGTAQPEPSPAAALSRAASSARTAGGAAPGRRAPTP